MKYFFDHWVDLTAMVLSLLAAIVLAVRLARKYAIRGIAAFFLLFGPLVIFVHMFFHLSNVTYNITERVRAHAFVYDFRTYSLYIMGALLGYLSFRLLQQSIYKCTSLQSRNAPIFKTMAAIALVSMPTIFFTPIGSLPTMGCIISLVALTFLKSKRKAQAKAVIVPVSAEAMAV